MIILDLNQVIISNIMAQVGTHTNVPIEINLVRHMVLNQIRYLRNKFRSEYGDELVIASDGRHYWRKDVFPFYKANRAKARKQSDFDWQSLFDCMNTLRDEFMEFMPYPMIQIDRAEADDIIATLVRAKIAVKILIVSGDGDFVQLQRYEGVKQYDPIRDKFLSTDDPVKFLREHIIRGDTGDGIPNIFSVDNSLVDGIRQKKVTAKLFEEWIGKDHATCDTPNYVRNRRLIDLTQTPSDLQSEIVNHYLQQKNKPRDKMLNYFINSKLKLLIQEIDQF
jgi:hypothetical protein